MFLLQSIFSMSFNCCISTRVTVSVSGEVFVVVSTQLILSRLQTKMIKKKKLQLLSIGQ